MKGIILLNGEPYLGQIVKGEGDFVLSADGALAWAADKVKIDACAGDFDSLGYVPEGAVVYPSEKNFTDGEIALDMLLDKGFDQIEIYGGGGGREDHFFGNLQLLYAGLQRGAHCVLRTNYSDITCERGLIRFCGERGRTVSLAPDGLSAHIMSSEGMKYPLEDLTLTAGSCRGVSNIVLSDDARLNCDEGAVFVFRNLSEESRL